MNITLTNVQCSDGLRNYSEIYWDTPNANRDSSNYCISVETYICSTADRAGINIILIFSSLAIVGFVIAFAYRKWEELTLGDFIIMAIGIIVGVILFTVAAQNLGGVCVT